jgi:hypothetical protein
MNASSPLPGTSVLATTILVTQPSVTAGVMVKGAQRRGAAALRPMLATISHYMRLNFFAPREQPDAQPPSSPQPMQPTSAAGAPRPARAEKTYPSDLIVWGIVIRNGFDELDDPWYHRGITQHAYVEGDDNAAICGFRPPLSGPRARRHPRLGLPTTGEHPMCGMCARMVVAPRPRVPIPVAPFRPAVAMSVQDARVAPVAIPVAPGSVPVAPGSVPVAPRTTLALNSGPMAVPASGPAPNSTSPWVRRATGEPAPAPQGAPAAPALGSHDAGLMARGIHATDDDR